ncbi:MAG: hypothetical protein EXS05_16720 [Planctomycetaceae bacterium]|nr:hypothetical protein [Planctomycetaceae bacterium]
MIRLLVDQNFNGHIQQGLVQRDPGIDLIHVRAVGLAAAPDPTILAWAAEHGRVLLTHDRQTLPAFAYARVEGGQLMPGVFVVSTAMPIGQAIDEVMLSAHCLTAQECSNIVKFFPM